jgi:very-short-patch-repair endonuclease
MSAHRNHISQHRQVKLAAHAHGMRLAPSEPERILWAALRASQLGVRFRRQVVVAGAIVDFFAPAARLVVEVDGSQHARQRGSDRRRDARLAERGLRVLRLEAQLVLRDLPEALRRVQEALAG